MPWPINRRNSLSCTVRTSQTKVVQSKGLLSDLYWVLEYHILLHVNSALDSLDDHLNVLFVKII